MVCVQLARTTTIGLHINNFSFGTRTTLNFRNVLRGLPTILSFMFWLALSLSLLFSDGEYPCSSLSCLSPKPFIEIYQTGKVINIDVHELLFCHAKISIRLAHFTQQIFDRGRYFVFCWHVKGHCSHFFDELFFSSTFPRSQANH